MNNYSEICHDMRSVALQAGELLLSYEGKIKDLRIMAKPGEGVVSEVDQKSEELIRQYLFKRYPNYHFIGEEQCFQNAQSLREQDIPNGYLWLVDPLDGTNNYLNTFPYYSVCICLLYNKIPQIGVVYHPSNDLCYYAIEGQGAFLSQLKTLTEPQRIFHASNSKELQDCLFSTGFAAEKKIVQAAQTEDIEMLSRFIQSTRSIRRVGSAALDMCYVATGQFDGFWERGLKPWDIAASSVICRESGVKITNFSGQNSSPFDSSIVLAREPLHQKFLSLLQSKN